MFGLSDYFYSVVNCIAINCQKMYQCGLLILVSTAEPHSGPSTPVSPTLSNATANRVALLSFGALGLGTAWWGLSQTGKSIEDEADQVVFTNWSGTHEVKPK